VSRLEPHPQAYDGLSALLEALDRDHGWASDYARWELALLAELGFGLDLGRCAATGTTSDLVYVSPKSGQAVSRGAGEAYRTRMLPLPEFLISDAQPNREAVLDALRLSGYFWEERVFRPHGRKLPAARTRFVDRLGRQAAVSRALTQSIT